MANLNKLTLSIRDTSNPLFCHVRQLSSRSENICDDETLMDWITSNTELKYHSNSFYVHILYSKISSSISFKLKQSYLSLSISPRHLHHVIFDYYRRVTIDQKNLFIY